MDPVEQLDGIVSRVPSRERVPSCSSDNRTRPEEEDDEKIIIEPCRLKSSPLRRPLLPITLKFEDVFYSIELGGGKVRAACFRSREGVELEHGRGSQLLLNGVSGIAHPGELLVILGPSGSGKTTLLSALGGRLPRKLSGGKITYNDCSFSSKVKRSIGFVPQEDVLFSNLTVLETLTYAALLRLPGNLTRRQKALQAESVIAELGLTRVTNSILGGALVRGLSGGERKRVSIGQELLINPSLLLLDEPTSGLDSTTAHRIITTLRRLAEFGRTVAATIHQPSSRLFAMFDKTIVLSQGCPIYTGESSRAMDYFSSIGFQPRIKFINPADFLLDLASGSLEEGDDRRIQTPSIQSLRSAYRRNLYPVLKAEIQNPSAHSKSRIGGESGHGRISWWEEFEVLLRRALQEKKSESYSALRIFHVLAVSIVSGLLWWQSDITNIQDQVGLLFFFSVFWGFFPLSNAIFAFPLDRAILRRELSSGMYRLSSYYFARTMADLPMELLLATVYTAITYWMGGLKRSILTFLLTLFIILLNVLVSQSFGLALGAVVMDAKQGSTLANVTMLIFLLAGGYYVQQVPSFVAWLKYFSFSHYCYKLLVGVQYSKHDTFDCSGGRRCSVAEFPAVKSLGIGDKGPDMFALLAMLGVFRLIAYAALRTKTI